MKHERPELEGGITIERISIPDDDIKGWKSTLLELGWPLSFVDRFLVRLNKSYGITPGLKERDAKMIDRIIYYDEIRKERSLTEAEQNDFDQIVKRFQNTAGQNE